MKKLIVALAVIITGYAVSAQEPIVYKASSTGTYNAYSIPAPIRTNYQAVYGDPDFVIWEPMDGWWYTTTKSNDNRIMHLYYPTDPWYLEQVPDDRQSQYHYSVALPVMNTYVPESVITAAINQHGNHLYSITKLKDNYQVASIENGVLTSVLMNEDGSAVVK